eukprot:INCI7250.6.p1 GENE.INCI7250.6~~INCI7250.6.p1  ORF type:complete len:194 (-),score=27.94 INCI7250.6:77-658(-)
MCDLYVDHRDDFTQGLAGGFFECGVGVFSFFRYRPEFADGPGASRMSAARRRSVLLARANKTAVHELGHMFSIGHCMHRQCCMNGSGHLCEDFSIPEHLCPVDLAKFASALGPDFNVLRRYARLLKYYKQRSGSGFAPQAQWVAKTLRYLAASSADLRLPIQKALEAAGLPSGVLQAGKGARNLPPARKKARQ